MLVAVGKLYLPEGLGSSTKADEGFRFANYVIILALLDVIWFLSKILLCGWDVWNGDFALCLLTFLADTLCEIAGWIFYYVEIGYFFCLA